MGFAIKMESFKNSRVCPTFLGNVKCGTKSHFSKDMIKKRDGVPIFLERLRSSFSCGAKGSSGRKSWNRVGGTPS